ncbi:LysR family transcriptional regulator [Kurthia massiliensis]|uniref:LysR family transcriptional regulator n=1 Tax=Kurthia massiliensis TaxID=1033739 RepID=UPI0002888990|nr:LysR family transcriptional regulator [Kurthia massiliensis]
MLEHLKIFIKVYEQRNFTKASELLFISQPTISTRIKQLEQQLQTHFFIRKGPKSIVPTEAAHTFYQYALKAVDDFNQTVEALHEEPRTRCHIACSNTIAIHYFPQTFPSLVAQFPAVDFKLSLYNSAEVVEGVKQHHVDIGLIEKPIDTYPLQKTALTTDELVLAGNVDSPYWLMRETDSGVHFFNELYIAEHNMNVQFIYLNSNEVIVELLKQGFGKTILSKKGLPTSIPTEKLSERYLRTLYVLSREDLPPQTADVYNAIVQAFSSI